MLSRAYRYLQAGQALQILSCHRCDESALYNHHPARFRNSVTFTF